MKRPKPAKRRDRKTGISPWVKYGKTPIQYSAEYRAWKARFSKKRPDRSEAA